MKKIKYSKERLKGNLRMGLFFIIMGILLHFIPNVFENSEIKTSSVGVGQIGSGIFILIVYYFENKNQYLTLNNGTLTRNTIIPSKIKLSEIKSIRHYAGVLKLFTDQKEFDITIKNIEPNSYAELKKELKKLDVKWH